MVETVERFHQLQIRSGEYANDVGNETLQVSDGQRKLLRRFEQAAVVFFIFAIPFPICIDFFLCWRGWETSWIVFLVNFGFYLPVLILIEWKGHHWSSTLQKGSVVMLVVMIAEHSFFLILGDDNQLFGNNLGPLEKNFSGMLGYVLVVVDCGFVGCWLQLRLQPISPNELSPFARDDDFCWLRDFIPALFAVAGPSVSFSRKIREIVTSPRFFHLGMAAFSWADLHSDLWVFSDQLRRLIHIILGCLPAD